MLSNAYVLAKVRFDTAENEPAKDLQEVYLINFETKKTQALPSARRVMRACPRGASAGSQAGVISGAG